MIVIVHARMHASVCVKDSNDDNPLDKDGVDLTRTNQLPEEKH